MKVVKEWLKGSQTVLSMFLVQVFATGMQILSRVILVEGTFIFALIAYRHVVAAVCVAPFALYFERQYILISYSSSSYYILFCIYQLSSTFSSHSLRCVVICRGRQKKLKWSIWFWLFLNALVGYACINLLISFLQQKSLKNEHRY